MILEVIKGGRPAIPPVAELLQELWPRHELNSAEYEMMCTGSWFLCFSPLQQCIVGHTVPVRHSPCCPASWTYSAVIMGAVVCQLAHLQMLRMDAISRVNSDFVAFRCSGVPRPYERVLGAGALGAPLV